MNTENQQQQPSQVTLEDIFKEVTEKAVSTETSPQEGDAAVLPKLPEVADLTTPTVGVKEEVATTPTAASEYSNKIKSFIDAKLLENFEITIDGEETFLADIDIKDEDTYNLILEQVKAEKEKQFKESYISKEGIDETTEKLIEIRKAGGSIREILKENVDAIEQLQNLKSLIEGDDDKAREQVSINILVQNLQQKGLSNKVINAQIQDYIDNGVLEEEAGSILNRHLSSHNQAIEDKRSAELARIEQEKEDSKTFKKTLNQQYKGWDIPDNIQKVLVENATKTDEYQISNTDKLYFESRKNPELFAKVNFFLNNPQEFEKWISGKKVLESKRDHVRSSISINTSKTKPVRTYDSNNLDEIGEQVFNK